MQPNVAICIHGGAQKTLRGREDRERERERERECQTFADTILSHTKSIWLMTCYQLFFLDQGVKDASVEVAPKTVKSSQALSGVAAFYVAHICTTWPWQNIEAEGAARHLIDPRPTAELHPGKGKEGTVPSAEGRMTMLRGSRAGGGAWCISADTA